MPFVFVSIVARSISGSLRKQNLSRTFASNHHHDFFSFREELSKTIEILKLLLEKGINLFNINNETISIFTHIQLIFDLYDTPEDTKSLLTCFSFLTNWYEHKYCPENFIDDDLFVKNVAVFLIWVPNYKIIQKIVNFGSNNI